MKRSLDILIIFLLTLVVHGWLIISRAIFWDDWLWYFSLATKNMQPLYNAAFQRGIPTDYYFWSFFSFFPDVAVSVRVTAFILIFVTALMVYLVFWQSGLMNRADSMMVAAIMISYPAFQTWFLISTSQYLFYYCVFSAAAFLAVRSTQKAGSMRWGFRVLSLLLFFLSFSLNSLLVFFYGFLLLLGLSVWKKQGGNIIGSLFRFSIGHLDYFILPFAYWIFKNLLFPTYGVYASYNQIDLQFARILELLQKYLAYPLLGQMRASYVLLVEHPVTLLFLLGVALLMWHFKIHHRISFDRSAWPLILMAVSLLWLGFGIFPYVVVGQYPSLSGWSTRHALLIALPVGLFLVNLIRLVFTQKDNRLSIPGWICFLALWVGFSGVTWQHYMNWEGRWIKDQSIISHLKDTPQAQKYSIFWVQDHFPLIEEETYRFYEWSSLFRMTWNDDRWIGLQQDDPWGNNFIASGEINNYRSYNYQDLDLAGCEAVLVIQPGPASIDSVRTVLTYTFNRYFRQDQLDEYLDQVTSVDVQPFASSLATNCAP